MKKRAYSKIVPIFRLWVECSKNTIRHAVAPRVRDHISKDFVLPVLNGFFINFILYTSSRCKLRKPNL